MILEQKYSELKKIIRGMDSVIVAFSGGVDSALVLKVAYDEIGNNAIGVTADSPSVPRREIEIAKQIARRVGAQHFIIETEETKNESYLQNPTNRCYFCKSELYTKIRDFAVQRKIKNILNGTNFDDLGDYRPGLKAADEYSVKSPLAEAKMTKEEVRKLARQLGLEIWDKPASPCLASRVPYGSEITLRKLKMIEDAENYLKDNFLLKDLRVRHFGNVARIELNKGDFFIFEQNNAKIKNEFVKIGFNEIELIEFKSGSLNVWLKVVN